MCEIAGRDSMRMHTTAFHALLMIHESGKQVLLGRMSSFCYVRKTCISVLLLGEGCYTLIDYIKRFMFPVILHEFSVTVGR